MATGRATAILKAWSEGRDSALEELMPLVYRELRQIAAAHLRRERSSHTLQPTALMHEAYLRLVDASGSVDCAGRAQLFGIAANLMRQILVRHAERRRSLKRGGGSQLVVLEQFNEPSAPAAVVDVLALDEALNRLTGISPRTTRVVELRYFCGLSETETAAALDVSVRTVRRDWTMAKAWLFGELSDQDNARRTRARP